MARDIQPAGKCSKCGDTNTSCRYNFFERDELTINSWEHKCGNCGVRETTAYRSDDPVEQQPENPACCPYCGRSGNR